MQNSIISVLSVGGFVTVFYMWTQMLLSLPPLSGAGKLVQGIAGGLLEVTAGCKILADTGSAPLTVVLCCFLISLGGLCIFLQSSVFYRKCGVGSGNAVQIDSGDFLRSFLHSARLFVSEMKSDGIF